MTLDPESEAIVTLGSKEGLANLAMAITSPGDVVLVPEPELSDPSFRFHHRRRGDPLPAGRGLDARGPG